MTTHDDQTPAAKAHLLRRLHHRGDLLLLPNAWDAASARLLEANGYPAIATSSAGVAAAQGYADGDIPAGEMLAAVARIARAVAIPVSADLEDAYGATGDLDRSVADVVAAGVAGLNIEDIRRGAAGLVAVEEQCARIRAIKSAAHRLGVPLVINARTDVFLKAIGEPAGREGAAAARLNAYRDAGADCLFAPGVKDADLIRRLVSAVHGPLNVLAVYGTPDLATLRSLGVARVSLGSGPMRLALTAFRDLLADLQHGSFDRLGGAMTYDETNALMDRRR